MMLPPAIGDQGQPVVGPDEKDSQGQDEGDDAQLDDHQAPGDEGVEAGAEDQEHREAHDHQGGGQVDDPPRLGKGRAAGPEGQVQAVGPEQVLEIEGPARGHGGGAHAVLQDQVPADDPGGQLPKNSVSVSVGAAGLGHHGGQFGITQGRQGTGPAGQEEGEDDARAGDLHAHPGDDEDAGADDLGHADDHQVQAGEAAAQGGGAVFGRRAAVQRLFSQQAPA